MKTVSVGIVAAVFLVLVSIGSHFVLQSRTQDALQLLEHCENAAQQDDWDTAAHFAALAESHWEEYATLYSLLLWEHHNEDISLSFDKLRVYVWLKENAPFWENSAMLKAMLTRTMRNYRLSFRTIV